MSTKIILVKYLNLMFVLFILTGVTFRKLERLIKQINSKSGIRSHTLYIYRRLVFFRWKSRNVDFWLKKRTRRF